MSGNLNYGELPEWLSPYLTADLPVEIDPHQYDWLVTGGLALTAILLLLAAIIGIYAVLSPRRELVAHPQDSFSPPPGGWIPAIAEWPVQDLPISFRQFCHSLQWEEIERMANSIAKKHRKTAAVFVLGDKRQVTAAAEQKFYQAGLHEAPSLGVAAVFWAPKAKRLAVAVNSAVASAELLGHLTDESGDPTQISATLLSLLAGAAPQC